jgi:hypothetical protein
MIVGRNVVRMMTWLFPRKIICIGEQDIEQLWLIGINVIAFTEEDNISLDRAPKPFLCSRSVSTSNVRLMKRRLIRHHRKRIVRLVRDVKNTPVEGLLTMRAAAYPLHVLPASGG